MSEKDSPGQRYTPPVPPPVPPPMPPPHDPLSNRTSVHDATQNAPTRTSSINSGDPSVSPTSSREQLRRNSPMNPSVIPSETSMRASTTSLASTSGGYETGISIASNPLTSIRPEQSNELVNPTTVTSLGESRRESITNVKSSRKVPSPSNEPTAPTSPPPITEKKTKDTRPNPISSVPPTNQMKAATPPTGKNVQKYQPPKSQFAANYSILVTGSESDSEASSVGSIPHIEEPSDMENAIFDAVSIGSVLKTKEYLDSFNFNLNLTNIVGYTILHIAIRRQDEEMVNLILQEGGDKIWPSVLEDSLLHAIKELHIDLVRTVLNELDRRNITTRKETTITRKLTPSYFINEEARNAEIEFPNSEFHEDMTPLLLSAVCDSYELVELFHARGHILRRPHENICSCDECRVIGMLRKSYRRLHVYQACSKPAYICYTANQATGKEDAQYDPILVAFTLIQKVRECAEEEIFRTEYLTIADELEEFAVNVVQQCRSTSEVEILLERGEGYTEASPYKRLSMAIELDLVNFVSHQHCQQILYGYWAGKSWPEWRGKSYFSVLLQSVIRIPLWPFIALWTCIDRSSPTGKMLSCPASAALNNVASYIIFIFMLLMLNVWGKSGAIHRGLPNSGFEYAILLWVAGFWLSTIRQFLIRFKSYSSSHWAAFDVVRNTMFVVAYVFWLITPVDPALDRKHWRPHDPTLVAEAVFAIASTMSVIRVMTIFQLSPRVGPLVTALGKMATDVLNIAIFIGITLCAFSLGISRLYRPYSGWEDYNEVTHTTTSQSDSFVSFINAFEALYWSIFSMGSYGDAEVIPRTIVSIRNSSVNATNHLEFTQNTGKVIYSVYHALVPLILLNMLIGLMSRTYELINSNFDGEWKFTRSKIWLSYGLDFVNPSPLNFIPPLPACMAICRKNTKKTEHSRDYYNLIRILIQRYFQDKGEIKQDEPATMETIEALHEDVAELRSLMEQAEQDEYERVKNRLASIHGDTPFMSHGSDLTKSILSDTSEDESYIRPVNKKLNSVRGQTSSTLTPNKSTSSPPPPISLSPITSTGANIPTTSDAGQRNVRFSGDHRNTSLRNGTRK